MYDADDDGMEKDVITLGCDDGGNDDFFPGRM